MGRGSEPYLASAWFPALALRRYRMDGPLAPARRGDESLQLMAGAAGLERLRAYEAGRVVAPVAAGIGLGPLAFTSLVHLALWGVRSIH